MDIFELNNILNQKLTKNGVGGIFSLEDSYGVQLVYSVNRDIEIYINGNSGDWGVFNIDNIKNSFVVEIGNGLFDSLTSAEYEDLYNKIDFVETITDEESIDLLIENIIDLKDFLENEVGFRIRM